MRQILPHVLPDLLKKYIQKIEVWKIKIFYFVLLFSFLSNSAFASHYKGGYFSYKYLGGGKYEFLIKGYWDHDMVGSTTLRFKGLPSITLPVTVSKTLLPDGETIEHVQKQVVTWKQPGIYEAYFNPCCMGEGSNYNNNLIGVFSVINYSATAPNSSPVYYDFPLMNHTAGQPFIHKLEMKDPEGDEQEFTLEIPNQLPANAYSEMVASGFQLASDGTIRWESPIAGTWQVLIRLHEKKNGQYTGVFSDRLTLITVNPADGNKAPVFVPLTTKTVRVGRTLSFNVEASDPDGQQVAVSTYGKLMESGATFTQVQAGNPSNGVFSWTPTAAHLGSHNLYLIAADNHQYPAITQTIVQVNVVECAAFEPVYTIKSPCAGSNNGKITVNASAGYSPFRYSVDNGATFQDHPEFENISPGSYTLLIEDAIGCLSSSANVVVEELPLPTVSLELPSSICSASSILELTSGAPSGGIYSGTGVQDGFFNPAIAGLGSHVIYYSYTDGYGCNNTASSEITVYESPVADAGPDAVVYLNGSEKRNCTSLTGNATGGALPYLYKWSTGEASQTIMVCPIVTTTYILTITDAKGCSDTSHVTVTVSDSKNSNSNSNRPDWAGRPDEVVSVFPNPANSQSEVSVRLPYQDEITIEIIDQNGRIVTTLYKGMVEAQEVMVFKIGDILTKSTPYFCKVVTKNRVYMTRIL